MSREQIVYYRNVTNEREFMASLLERFAASPPHVVARTSPGSATAGPHAVFAPVPVLLISLAGERRHRYESARGTTESVRLTASEALLETAGTWLETTYVVSNNALSVRSYEGVVRMVYIEGRPGRNQPIHRGSPARVLEFVDENKRLATVMETLVIPGAPSARAYLDACATIITGELRDMVRATSPSPGSADRDASWRMLVTWVQETVGTHATRTEAARAVRLHPNHVSRICRNHGTTYSRLVHTTRIRYAQELLTSTPLTVSEIAYTCGYADPPNFHHEFRRHLGCTPSEYRTSRPSAAAKPSGGTTGSPARG